MATLHLASLRVFNKRPLVVEESMHVTSNVANPNTSMRIEDVDEDIVDKLGGQEIKDDDEPQPIEKEESIFEPPQQLQQEVKEVHNLPKE